MLILQYLWLTIYLKIPRKAARGSKVELNRIIRGGGGHYPSSSAEAKARWLGLSWKRIALFGLLILSPCLLPSAPMECVWTTDDGGVRYFRYQLDGEEPDGWTVVDSSVRGAMVDAGDAGFTLHVQASYDGTAWSESAVEAYVIPMEEDRAEPSDPLGCNQANDGYPQEEVPIGNAAKSNSLRVVVEKLIFKGDGATPEDTLPLAIEELEAGPSHLSYRWSDGGYGWLRFRVNDEPWYLVDSNATGVVLRLMEGEKEDYTFQLKGSADGKNWTERETVNDNGNRYNEAYMDREGWVLSSSLSVLYPYLVAFFTPSEGTINYTTPRELTTDSLKFSLAGSIGASLETKGGNGYGLSFNYTYSPTDKGDPFTVASILFTYSRMLYRTPRYNALQLWLEGGIGPSLSLFQDVGAFGISLSLGLSVRHEFPNSLVLWTSLGTTVVSEPNLNDRDQLTLGTTFYATLPLSIGISYSFKDVRD